MAAFFRVFLLSIILTCAGFPSIARANVFSDALDRVIGNESPDGGPTVQGNAQVGDVSLERSVADLITVALSLIGAIFFVLMFYAGYLWMTAHGQTDQVEKAKKIIAAAVIGMIVTLGAYAVSYLVVSNLEKAAGLA